MSLNIFHISDNIADQINDALTNALESAYVSSHDVSTGAIEEYIDQLVEEAIEKDREERKPEAPFTFSELMELRRGIHQLRMKDIEDRAAQFAVAIEFGIDFDSDKWKEFKMKRDTQLEALYDKVSELINNLNAK